MCYVAAEYARGGGRCVGYRTDFLAPAMLEACPSHHAFHNTQPPRLKKLSYRFVYILDMSIDPNQLRSLVQDCIAKHLYSTAVFYADKLVTLTEYAPGDVFLLAQVLQDALVA